MKRFSTLLRGKGSKNEPSRSNTIAELENAPADTPEGNASRAVRLFCESGSTANRDEEVLHLPTIVDAAESSPAAAAACATQIRAFLQKQYMSKPHVQYNAIMLIRILSDNPGASFTRNFDDKFVKSVKTNLRDGKDLNVQQLLRETLDSLAASIPHDAGARGLIQMWTREKTLFSPYSSNAQGVRTTATHNGAHVASSPPPMMHNNSHTSSRHARGQLPSQPELASRIEESRNTAKILIQLLQTTPADEVSSNELIREFADRCQSAQRSMQTYINCENPPPDDDTLQTLIETNEQLSLASSRYQRALLAARRAQGLSPSPNLESRSGSISAPVRQVDDRLLTPPLQPNSFGSQQNGYTYNAASAVQQSYNPPVSPPVSPPLHDHQHNRFMPSQAASRPGDDYDDLYDSPRALRAPANNPFSDPTEQPSPPASQHQRLSYNQYSDPPLPLGNAYASPPQHGISPQQSHSPRPAPGPWHNSVVTPSFLGRQASAADGLTMHAPGTPYTPAEIDGHSSVGRMDYQRAEPPTSFTVTDASIDAPAQRSSRVDIAGTGGFKPI